MHVLPSILVLHVAAGILALAVLWFPLFAKKGGRVHVVAGRVYVWAMGVSAATAAPLSIRMMLEPASNRRAAGLFLAYVGLLAWDNAWMGVRSLRTKQRNAPNRRLFDLLPPSALLFGAIGVFVLGVARGRVLFLAFAVLGAFLAVTHLLFWLRTPKSRFESMSMHIGGMGASCIATLTAFLVANAGRLGLGGGNLALWLAPGLVGGVAIALAQRRWRAKMGRGPEDGYAPTRPTVQGMPQRSPTSVLPTSAPPAK